MRGAGELPAIVLGDHGFMTLYGSRLSDADIVARMSEALAAGIPMLSGGDLRLGALVREAFAEHDLPPRWIKHLDAPLKAGAEPLPFPRAMATLRSQVLDRMGRVVLDDPIMGPFLERYAEEPALEPGEIAGLQLDIGELQLHLRAITELAPSIVTLGGDGTDFLLACGRCDLLNHLIDQIATAAAAAGSATFVCTYVGFGWPELFQAIAARVDVAGLMLPANVAGIGMLPSPVTVRAGCRELGKPVLAMHALAIGELPIETAVPELLRWPEIGGAIIGASSSKHIQQLVAVRRGILADSTEHVE